MKIFYALIFVFLLIILGDYYAKIALGIAALVFLGSLIYNLPKIKEE